MILQIFLILVAIAFSLIIVGLTKPKESAQALVGFSFLFMLSFVVAGGNLEYKSGERINYTEYVVPGSGGSYIERLNTSNEFEYNKTSFNSSLNGIGLCSDPGCKELPNNQAHDGFIDMTGNVLLMHLNSTDGVNVYDSSGEGNNGKIQNGVIINSTSGWLNNGSHLDGVGDYINVTDDASLDLDYVTLSVWAKSDMTLAEYSHYGYILSKNADYSIFIDHNLNTLTFKIYNESGTISMLSRSLDVTQWHHYAMTYNGSNLTAYIDGVAYTGVGGTLAKGPIRKNNEPFTIGNLRNLNPTTYQYKFNGSIDEVAIFNRSLSQTEITNIYYRQVSNYFGFNNSVYFPTAINNSKISELVNSINWSATNGTSCNCDINLNYTLDNGSEYICPYPSCSLEFNIGNITPKVFFTGNGSGTSILHYIDIYINGSAPITQDVMITNYTYSEYTDTTGLFNSQRFGYFMAVASFIGFIGTLVSLKGGWSE